MNSFPALWIFAFLLTFASDGAVHAKAARFNLAASKAVLSGYWPPSSDGARTFAGGSNGSQLDAAVTGTWVELTCFSTLATSATITVDGVTSTPTFATTNAWTTLKIDLGGEGTHALTVKQSFLASPFYIDTGNGPGGTTTFLVHGGAPSIGPPAAGFGPQYELSDPVNVTFDIQAEGGLAQTDINGYPSIYHNTTYFTDEAIYFTASSTGTIQGWIYGSGGMLGVFMDGARVGKVPVPFTNTYQWITLFVGDGSPHRYGVTQSYYGPDKDADSLSIWSLMTVDGALTAVTTPVRPRFIAFGDSITAAQIGVQDESSQAYPQRIGAKLGWAVFNRGISGTTVHQFPSGSSAFTKNAGENRAADVTSNADGARGVVILYGTNDMAQHGGPETMAEFRASYRNMMAQIVAGVPATCPIVCVGILPRTDFSPDTIGRWNAAIQAAIAAVATPNVRYVDPSTWGLMQNNGATANYTDVNHNTPDGIHPNANGYGILVRRLVPFFAAPGAPVVTSAGQADGVVGRAISYQITAGNLPTGFNCTDLPPGLVLQPVTGVISGTPAAAGSFNVTVAAANTDGTGLGTIRFDFTLPTVTLAATVPTVAGKAGKAGRFTVSIPSTLTSDLTVRYTVSGSAAAGTDYAALNGIAIVPAGHASKVIKIRPMENAARTGTKVVKLKLVPGGDYVPEIIAPARVKILAGP